MSLVTKTYGGVKLEPFMDPESAVTESVVFAASKTIAKGTVVAIVTSGGKFAAYDDSLSTGVEVAKGIAMYDFTTDASSKVTIGGDSSVTYDSAPIYIKGYFRTTELVGLDAAAVADLGRITQGTVADGVLHIS